MKVLILMGSPRIHGNTAELCKPFMQELEVNQVTVNYIELEKKTIQPCKACYACQDVAGEYGCVHMDDMYEIVDNILWADCIILATPIFSWYCSAKMKAVLDRHYGLNKYYGNCSGCLWEGKKVGIIATHGYEGAYATEPFELGVKRLCEHSNLQYIGLYSVQDEENLASFQTEEAMEGAREFARKVIDMLKGKRKRDE
ncbi:MAG: flavodoxin family protein [Lachnospiraceae bacterium]|nr:flavodoxin family protein [Lachnospiraceae bacterium]